MAIANCPYLLPSPLRTYLICHSADSADVPPRLVVGGEVESSLKRDVQQLRSKVRELEDDYKQMSACKHKVVEELMAKCTAEEEGRRKAEVLLERSDEACRRAEEGQRLAEEAKRRAEEARRRAEDTLHGMQLQKNHVESELEYYHKAADGRMWQQGKFDRLQDTGE